MHYTLHVNGQSHSVDVDSDTPVYRKLKPAHSAGIATHVRFRGFILFFCSKHLFFKAIRCVVRGRTNDR